MVIKSCLSCQGSDAGCMSYHHWSRLAGSGHEPRQGSKGLGFYACLVLAADLGMSTCRQSSGPRRQVTRMMPIGVPRVPYRTPQSGGWQWVDIWNCLVSFCSSLSTHRQGCLLCMVATDITALLKQDRSVSFIAVCTRVLMHDTSVLMLHLPTACSFWS